MRYDVSVQMFLGIDGGGSSTSARVEDDAGDVVFERSTGPTNPRTVPPSLLGHRFDELLEGCPTPKAAAVCLAGMASHDTRRAVAHHFDERFPTMLLRLEPDFVAALACFESWVTVCVIAGTGSLVCSRAPIGALVTSGGKGFLLGDHGSAFRLGQRLVGRYVEDPSAVDDRGPAIDAALDVADASEIVRAVHTSADPASLIARAAPVLTGAAEDGRAWARELVSDEMQMLATTVGAHLERHHSEVARPVIGLVGGVWAGPAARDSFEQGLRAAGVAFLSLQRAPRSPVHGAVLLAREAAV